jgi:hypothetical protein
LAVADFAENVLTTTSAAGITDIGYCCSLFTTTIN